MTRLNTITTATTSESTGSSSGDPLSKGAEGVEGGCGGPLVVENDIAVGELGFQETEGEQLVNGEHMAVEVFETASLVIAITVVSSLLVLIWSSRCSGLRYRLFRVELCFADSVSRDAGQLRYREEKNSH